MTLYRNIISVCLSLLLAFAGIAAADARLDADSIYSLTICSDQGEQTILTDKDGTPVSGQSLHVCLECCLVGSGVSKTTLSEGELRLARCDEHVHAVLVPTRHISNLRPFTRAPPVDV